MKPKIFTLNAVFLATAVLLMSPISSSAQTIAGGRGHSLVVCTDNTVRSFGLNDWGQLGNGTNNNSNVPVSVSSLNGITSVATGVEHSLALKNDGTVWGWGLNFSGQLGNGIQTSSNVPVQNNLSNVIAISAGQYHSLSLKNDGTVWAWGNNNSGELGNGTGNGLSLVPVQVNNLINVIAISSGYSHNLALKSDGTVWAWGYNGYGQIGIGSLTPLFVTAPVQVSNFTDVIAIAGGYNHSLALKSDGTVLAWGNNSSGQIGIGSNTPSTVISPMQVSNLTNVIAIAGADGHSLALKNDGTVWAWGFNSQGQLGNGNNTESHVPVQVSNLSGVAAIAAGRNHSLVRKNDGTVWTWGQNGTGQLGNGTLTNSNVPLQVTGLCPSLSFFYIDIDGDGFGDPNNSIQASTAPPGYVTDNTDCDDASAAIHPGATELCNGVDDNCDGNTDEGLTNTYYRDADGDSYGSAAVTIQACTAPAGYVNNSTDCDDASASVHPDATELCNGVDDDCDGATDEGVTTTYYRDADGDSYGNAAVTTQACTVPAGYVTDNTDCNDASSSVHPGATEVCNGVDDNCDGNTDEGLTNTYYRDADGDSYGNAAVTTQACTVPAGYVSNNTDCNDASAAIHPGATEVCNGVNDNCDGNTDEGCPPSITIHDVTVLESAGNALVPVTLSIASALTVTVKYKTVNGTARSRKDFTSVSGTLTFAPGLVSQNISVPILADAVAEPDETFTVVLTLPKNPNPNATIADGSATVTITETALRISAKQRPLFEDSKAEELKLVVPNPQRKHEQLRFYGMQPGSFDILLTDVNGKVVVKQKNYRNNWSMARLTPGIYFYQFVYRNQKGEQKIKTGKLIIID
jgi:alpha-tubulin suppressor-like RCC1 family protein